MTIRTGEMEFVKYRRYVESLGQRRAMERVVEKMQAEGFEVGYKEKNYHVKDYDGVHISCVLGGYSIDDALIRVIDDGRIYILQNVYSGNVPPDKDLKGYTFSWEASGTHSFGNLQAHLLTGGELRHLEEGNVIANGKFTRTVLGVDGQMILVSSAEDLVTPYGVLSLSALEKAGYKKLEVREDKVKV